MPSKISLVMTVYNRERYLPQALDSILAQTYPHWQLTLWDDGSTDASPEIAKAYAESDARIHFIAAAHLGRVPALHAAIAIAQVTDDFPYLAFVDSDDLLGANALIATAEILDTHPSVGMVYTDYIKIDEQGKNQGIGARCGIPYSKDRLLVDFMTFHFRLLRRELYDRVGGIDLDFQSAEDYDLCLKLSEVTEIYHLPAPLYAYREHPHSISQARIQEQIEYSGKAVSNALVRRGLAEKYQLIISPTGQFTVQSGVRSDRFPVHDRYPSKRPTPAPVGVAAQPDGTRVPQPETALSLSSPTDVQSMNMVYVAPDESPRSENPTREEMQTDRGVIYCATSHFLYLEAALISALTLRKFEPNLPITLVSDCRSLQSLIPDRYQIDAKFVELPPNLRATSPFASRLIKTDLWQFTQYPQTLFLDADILPLQPLTPIWQHLEHGDVAMALDKQPTIADCNHIGQTERDYTTSLYPGSTPHYNSGVILWRNGADAERLFQTWKQEWSHFQQQDQLALARAIQSTATHIVQLPQSYNFSLTDLTPAQLGYASWSGNPTDATPLGYRDPNLYLLHCWGGLVMKGHFQQIAQQIDPQITTLVSEILTPIFTRQVSPHPVTK